MRYQTEEYAALLTAQRTLTKLLAPVEVEHDGEKTLTYPDPTKAAACASALRGVIDQKRIMRGQGAPKPVEARNTVRTTKASQSNLLIDVVPSPPAPVPASSSTSAAPTV